MPHLHYVGLENSSGITATVSPREPPPPTHPKGKVLLGQPQLLEDTTVVTRLVPGVLKERDLVYLLHSTTSSPGCD